MLKQLSAFAVYNKKEKMKSAITNKTNRVKHSKRKMGQVSNFVEKLDVSNEVQPLGSNKSGTKRKKPMSKAVHKEKKHKRQSHSLEGTTSFKKQKTLPKESRKLKKTSRNEFVVTKVIDDDDEVINVEDDIDSDVPQLVEAQVKVTGDTEKTNTSISKFTLDEIAEDNLFEVPKNVLNFLLAPINPKEFFENYWERRPLHISRKNSAYFGNLLTSEGLDKMLRKNALYYTRNVDVVTYENDVRLTHNPEGRAKPASIWDYYSNGCSVRILNPQTYSLKVHALLATLQEYFGTMVGANVYLTPRGSQGFAPHYDDIEAFVLQLEGRKHWKIYSPRSESEILPRYSSANLRREDLKYPLMELTAEAGDLLYFPRGFIHEACTDDDAHSLHMTVSVYQNTAYIDLLEKLLPEALKVAARDHVEFRQGLPLHYLNELGAANADKPSVLRDTLINNVRKLMLKLTNNLPIDWAVDQMGRKFMYDALPPVLFPSENDRSCKNDGDHLVDGNVQDRAEFALDTMVRLVRYHSLRLVLEGDGSAKLYYCTENSNTYHGEDEQCLEVDVGMFDVVQVLIRNYPKYISIEDIPNQNETDKMNIISDLWEKGLIVTKESLDICD